jgi:phenylalanyl-tRNA synthetase beta chain
MKISWTWLQEILAVRSDLKTATELLTDIGLEVEAVESYQSVKGGLEGLITGEVVAIAPHPDADRLQVCQVQVGGPDILQIVCGAPNVAKGQKVIVATVGTTIHPMQGESFTIKKAKIRGVESNGMLCAEDEIGLGDSHAGLMILPANTETGIPLNQLLPVYADQIIEIGLTANHADAYSQWGTAVELYTALHVREIEEPALAFPKGHLLKTGECPIQVEVQNHTACPRYSGVLINHIQVGPSPEWMQQRLKAMGMRPVNNIVDATNYVLLELGQPLHAFDADAIQGKRIIVRNVDDGTPFTGLDDKTYTLSGQELMICDAAGPMCIAGIFGGKDSGIHAQSTSVFLESAFFAGSVIRKSEGRLGLKTDASSRFAKGTDPEMTVKALERAVHLILETAGGEIAGGLIDLYPEPVKPVTINLRYKTLRTIAGTDIPKNILDKILKCLQINILAETSEALQLEVPARKNDVLREIDMVEEVLRMYGYNHIPMPEGVKVPFTLSVRPDLEKIRTDAGKHLSAHGFYEIFTNSISKSKYVSTWMPGNEHKVVQLLNSLNAELDSLRPTTLFSGLEIVQWNSNRRMQDLRLYEFGKIFNRAADHYTETSVLSLFMTGRKEEESWNSSKDSINLFDLKTVLHQLADHLRVPYEETIFESHPLLDEAIAIGSGEEVAGVYGRVKPDICAAFDLRNPLYFAEIFWVKWLDKRRSESRFKPLPRFPEVRRDLALILDKAIHFDKVHAITRLHGGKLLQHVNLFDIYEGSNLNGKKSYAISLVFRDDEKTLTDKEVEAVVQKIIQALEKEAGAAIRQS